MTSGTVPPLPDFLAGAFSAEELERAESTIAVIDASGEILWANPAWHRFSRQNGGSVPASGSYFDGISPTLRGYYQSAFTNALATEEVFDHEYECSSPEQFRIYHLRVLPIQGRALLLEHSLVVQHSHETGVAGVAEAYLDETGVIVQCSNCRRVRRPRSHSWDWVPALVAAAHPRTSHGICASCAGYYWGTRRGRARRK